MGIKKLHGILAAALLCAAIPARAAETCPRLRAFWNSLRKSDETPSSPPGTQAQTRAEQQAEQLISALGEPVSKDTADLLFRAEKFRVLPAVADVLRARAGRGEPPPKNLVPLSGSVEPTDVKSFGEEWLRKAQSRAMLPEYGKEIRLIPVSGGLRTKVYLAKINGRYYFFRPVNEGTGSMKLDPATIVRRTLAASRLNALLALRTVPNAWLVRVNGTLGSLSEEAPGGPAVDVSRKTFNPRSYADALAYEFWIANSDINELGYHILKGPDGLNTLQVVDHDPAFRTGLPEYFARYRLGGFLPKAYTREFIEALRALTPDRLRNEMGNDLSADEIDGLLFRREVILRDAETRDSYLETEAPPDPKAQVDRVVPGLYGSVPASSAVTADGLTFTTIVTRGSYFTRVTVEGTSKLVASFSRVFSGDEKTLVFGAAHSEGPSFVDAPGVKPLVPGRGVPLQAFVTLMQMRLAGVRFGQLREAETYGISNAQTALELMRVPRIRDWALAHPGEQVPAALLAEAVMQTGTGRYINTVLTQSGHRVVAVEILPDGPKFETLPLMEVMADAAAAAHKRGKDTTLPKMPFPPDQPVPFGYKIRLKLEPLNAIDRVQQTR